MDNKIIDNHISRMIPINSAIYDIVYNSMLDNVDITSIRLRLVAIYKTQEGVQHISPWIPAPLVPYVNQETGFVVLAITPTGILNYTFADGIVSFNCRVSGVPISVSFCVDQIAELFGLDSKGKVIDSQLFEYLVYDEYPSHQDTSNDPKPKPKLSIVK